MLLVTAYLSLASLFAIAVGQNTTCSSDAIGTPELFGGEILSLTADPVTNYNGNLSFCNVTILYTHPNQNDRINVFLWLPSTTWNGRFVGTGGGSYRMRSADSVLASNVANGYAVVATDGGHDWRVNDVDPWALASPGNVNYYALNNFASVALEDAGLLGKAIATTFYGRGPAYSYFSGCSTGGRQGLMIAQRYPTLYDGIVANAPAINWAKLLVAGYWGQLNINLLNATPTVAEYDALTRAAIAACDTLDNVADNIIALPENCTFSAVSVAGQALPYANGTVTITESTAQVVDAIWQGPRSRSGAFQFYGYTRNTPVSTQITAPTGNAPAWIRNFIARDLAFDPATLDRAGFDAVFRRSVNEFTSVISAVDADLSLFKEGGGKLITWHGLADQLIPPDGTTQYYEDVAALDPDVADYYRYFKAPGVQHCSGGIGPQPVGVFDRLVDWVERGVAPDVLPAAIGTGEARREWNLCAYPKVTAYKGDGDIKLASSYECRDSF